MNRALLSSQSIEWATPPEVFNLLNDVHHFTLDVCARPWNKKVDKYFSPEDNGLVQSWAGHVCWMNPPYGRQIGKWIEKAVKESTHAKVVCLLPARTDTKYFHNMIRPHSVSMTFLAGRVAFLREDKDSVVRAPFPSMVVVFDARAESGSKSEGKDPAGDGLADAG